MKMKGVLSTLTFTAGALCAVPLRAQTDQWTFDVTLYGLAAGMSGDVTVKGIDADLDVGFDKIWDNLEFGAMGKVRVGYGRWALSTDVIYMGLGASKNGVTVDFDEWIVEPSLTYTVSKYFEVLAGARYNTMTADIRGTGPLGNFRESSGTQDWWDPIVGANVRLPFAKQFSLNMRGDIGGFGVGSDLTWQAFPFVSWQFIRWGSLQAGYRWVYTDYETGSGQNQFRYDVLSQGPQLGFTASF
jgi:hypothetical protein